VAAVGVGGGVAARPRSLFLSPNSKCVVCVCGCVCARSYGAPRMGPLCVSRASHVGANRVAPLRVPRAPRVTRFVNKNAEPASAPKLDSVLAKLDGEVCVRARVHVVRLVGRGWLAI
jgi:hypothetical protein